MITVVGGTKGGTGKTTIATNLTFIRSHQGGKKVLLVDADELRTSTKSCNQRSGSGIETKWSTIQLGGKNLHSQVLRLKSDFDDIIIDVGGRDTSSQRSSLVVADIYLLPFNPSSYDIWTISEVKSMLTDMIAVNEKLKAFAFLNRADPNGDDNKEAINILKEYEEFECLDIVIGNRKTFRRSSSDGLSVFEMKNPDKKAMQEMQNLYDFVYNKCTFSV